MLALLLTLATAPSAGSALHVRSSAAFAPCLDPVVKAFTRDSGMAAALDVGAPDPVADADIVVGDDSEMTRLLEGGAASLATAVDLGEVPWVHVAPEGLSSAAAEGPVAVLGGPAGREARTMLSMARKAMRVSSDPQEMRRASVALVPFSLAGPGARRPAADLTPLRATAAEIGAARNRAAARRFLAFLRSLEARSAIDRCFGGPPVAPDKAAPTALDVYGRAVVDWWLPECSRSRNAHNDPQQAVGPPDAARIGDDRYRGLISLGQGGYVTLELGEAAVDAPGPDIRVFQTTSSEPVSLYAAASAQGPFVLLGLRRSCGVRPGGTGVFSNHCDFDLRDGGLTLARFVKVEDGEIYPCLAGGTLTEGADLDAVQTLNR
jgi:hypothetical protein